MTPRVSVIIPAFRAFDTLARGLETVAACGLPERAVEIVIAPDDGADYSRFSDGWGQRRVLPPGPVRSGAGPTRNRALAAASGDFIAFLDADDSWEEGYLAATLPLARRMASPSDAPASSRTGARSCACREQPPSTSPMSAQPVPASTRSCGATGPAPS